MEFDTYFQDNWHATKNLTVNLGLRYEAHPAMWTKDGMTTSFDLKNKAVVLANQPSWYVNHGYTTSAIINNMTNLGMVFETPSQAGYPSTMVRNYLLTASPRVGFAYQPFDSRHGTVLRGAYGRYIYPIPIRNAAFNTATGLPFVASYSMDYNSAAQSPDGGSNYFLRHPQPVVMGITSGSQSDTNVVNTTSANAILPGIGLFTLDPAQPPNFVTQVNFTIEQPLKGNSVLRLSYLWTHGTNLDHYYYYNQHPSTFVWEMNTGTALPTGGASVIGTPAQNTYASTATGSYDQSVYSGGMNWDTREGWSNDNALQVNYQRLFHNGIAYQVSYVWSKPFRLGGNYFRDANVYTAQSYLGAGGTAGSFTSPYPVTPAAQPPSRPAGIASYANWRDLTKWEQYGIDTGIPKKHINFNGIYDLPLGKGKKYLGNSGRMMDELVGGWELAGSGSIMSLDFGVGSGNWGPNNPIQVYKHGAKITDCRSGVCHPAREWFNGYIAPSSLPGTAVACGASNPAAVVYGLPSSWVPYQSPIDTNCNPKDSNFNSNNVTVNLTNGKTDKQGYGSGSAGTNRYSHTVLNGPMNLSLDMSLFKVFPITEKTSLRMNVDAFNAPNMMGEGNPDGTTGIQQLQPGVGVTSSYLTPRQVQFTLRLTF
jgi:hypothetical protein